MKKNSKFLILGLLSIMLILSLAIPQNKSGAISSKEELLSTSKEEFRKNTDDEIVFSFMGNMKLKNKDLKSYDMEKLNSYFENINYFTKTSDVVSAQVEGKVVENIDSEDENLVTPHSFLERMKDANINYVQTANGINIKESTTELFKMQEILSFNNMKNLGSRYSLDEEPYIIEEIKGRKIGIVNFSNLIAKDGRFYMDNMEVSKQAASLVNTINYEALGEDTKKIKSIINEISTQCDFIISYVNFLDDKSNLTKERENTIIKTLNECGVDIIVGTGKGKISPIKKVKSEFNNNETIVIYSLGDIKISDNEFKIENSSIMATISLDIKDENIKIKDINYVPLYVYRFGEKDSGEYKILPLSFISTGKNNYNVKSDDLLRLDDLKRDVIKVVENREEKVYLYKK